MTKKKVSTIGLNFRKSPVVRQDNIIIVLKLDQEVDVLKEYSTGWSEVRFGDLNGYVKSNFLEEVNNGESVNSTIIITTKGQIPEVHLRENKEATLFARNKSAFPLYAPDLPIYKEVNLVKKIIGTIKHLDVENPKKLRYQPWLYKRTENGEEKSSWITYCNIYAHDFCKLNGVYLPRVWWDSKILSKFVAGGNSFPEKPKYGIDIFEQNANMLFDWLNTYGDNFGWVEVQTTSELQEKANEGKIAIIIAKQRNLNRSGHVAFVVPESPVLNLDKLSGRELGVPLTSQAGITNFKYRYAKPWWKDSKYIGFKFWVNNEDHQVLGTTN